MTHFKLQCQRIRFSLKRGDEQKLGDVLNKIASEDPSLRIEHRAHIILTWDRLSILAAVHRIKKC